jgi:hypothetical protein
MEIDLLRRAAMENIDLIMHCAFVAHQFADIVIGRIAIALPSCA